MLCRVNLLYHFHHMKSDRLKDCLGLYIELMNEFHLIYVYNVIYNLSGYGF